MRIAICVKQVPATADVQIDRVTKRLKRENNAVEMNACDCYAMELALRLREKYGASVTAFTMGPPQARAVLKNCRALGAESGYILNDMAFAGSDTYATAHILSCAIKADETENGPFDLMHYNTELNNHGLKADPFKACVGPRPIAWISTVSADGVDNLAPFSQFNNLSYNPPMVMISFQPTGTEEEACKKDTLVNIEETGSFVYNMVPYALKDKMNITAIPSHDLDEWEAAGLTKADSIQVPAKRVAESPIQFECEYVQTIHFPSKSKKGVIDMVIAKVVEVHIDDDVLTPDGKIDFLKIKPLGRMGYWDYTYVNDVFSMAIPGLTAAQMSGMGGDRLKKD